MSRIKDWWDIKHSEKSVPYLCGSRFNEVIKNLYIEKIVSPRISVLEIGSGLGICTEEMKRTMNVDVLDISRNAPYLTYLFPTSKIPYNRYDLIISHFVSQHMNDEDLKKQ